MRLVTWNCNKGAYSKKVPLLEPMAADIAVIQECAKPGDESNRCRWFGDKANQGVLVLAGPAYSIRRLPALEGVPKFVIPVGVSGPGIEFTLLAVWAKGRSMSGYVQCVLTAVGMYRELIASLPCVLMGDMNSSVAYARHCTSEFNHSILVTLLESVGFSSAYHCFFDESQGIESRPTYYHRWNEHSPFHIDYCFLPSSWAKQIAHVEVGGFDDWKGLSDHRPLLVDIDFNREIAVTRRPAA
jgi:exodeoxyribonuclease III